MNALLTCLQTLTQQEARPYTGAELSEQYTLQTGEKISAVAIGTAKSWGFESWVQQNEVLKAPVNGKQAYTLVSRSEAIPEVIEDAVQTSTEDNIDLSDFVTVTMHSSHLSDELNATVQRLDNGKYSFQKPGMTMVLDKAIWLDDAPEVEFDTVGDSLATYLEGSVGDDDLPDEPGSAEILSQQVAGSRTPNWKLLFGKLDEINPIAARIAALMGCWWHPSFEADEQRWLCGLVNEGLEAIALGDEAKVLDVAYKISQFKLVPEKHGWVVAALIQVCAPKPLLKNPLCEFNETQGTYSHKGGQRQPKIAIISMTGSTGSGKSEFEKWLGLLCEDKQSLGEKPMAAAAAVSARKDISLNSGQEGRLGNEPYVTGWKGQPVEYWNKQQQQFENVLFCFSDLKRTGTDLPNLVSIMKAFCESEVITTRQDASLSKNNKSWLLYGANACFSSTRPFSSDDDDPLAEVIRRSFMVFCKKHSTDAKGRKIAPLLSKFQNFNWDGFSLSYVWQEQYIKPGVSASPNRFVVTKDSKNGNAENGYLMYHIQRELERAFAWEKDYEFPSERWDFIASAAAYGSVAYVRTKKWLSECELIACYQNYFAVLQSNMAKSSTTTTELKRSFKTYIDGRLAEHKKRNSNFDVKAEGLSGEEVRIGYDATIKWLNPKGNDRIPLVELMASLGFIPETASKDGTPFTEPYANSTNIYVKFFPVEQEEDTTA